MIMEELKIKVYEFYEKNKKIYSPIFDLIKITPQSLWHLENKDKHHKRPEKEAEMRMKCFLSIDRIIKQSCLYQEYKQELEDVIIKKYWKRIKVPRKVNYYGLVWILHTDTGSRIRIKVVIKKVNDRKYAEFISVIPARNIKWYNRLYFENEE